MPFKSKAQIAKIAELEKQGKVKPGTFKEFMGATKNPKSLPQRITPKKEGPAKSTEDLRSKFKSRFGVK